MKWSKNWLLLIAAPLAIISITWISISISNQETAGPPVFNTVNDSISGLSFNMSKSFTPIARSDLAKLNPEFSYGYQAIDDPSAQCLISQTVLKGSGTLTGTQLRDGVLREVKKVHPNVDLINNARATNLVKFGEAKGVLLELTYKEAAVKIKRVEIIAVGKANQVIAYCQSRAADNQKYYDDFTVFFSSLKLSS